MAADAGGHKFGGRWTQTKLDVLQKYLRFYTQALKNRRFELVYIDAFAGTGRCIIRHPHGTREIHGSARIALDTEPPFQRFVFIEKKKRFRNALNELLAAHPTQPCARTSIIAGEADGQIEGVLAANNWKNTRGVLFLDPYGLQCDWTTVKKIAATEALDVFFLVSVFGLYRQATNDLRDVDVHKAAALDKFLGTQAWRDELYRKQEDLFGDHSHTRSEDAAGLTRYVKRRLDEVFAWVGEPVLLHQETKHGRRGAPLYALFFAVSNPSPKAIELARKVSREIMAPLQ